MDGSMLNVAVLSAPPINDAYPDGSHALMKDHPGDLRFRGTDDDADCRPNKDGQPSAEVGEGRAQTGENIVR
jgi:hypothetical protein